MLERDNEAEEDGGDKRWTSDDKKFSSRRGNVFDVRCS